MFQLYVFSFFILAGIFDLSLSEAKNVPPVSNVNSNSRQGQEPTPAAPTTPKVMYAHPYWDKFGEFDGASCVLNKRLKKEIKTYQPIVEQIMSVVTNGSFKGETYKHLAHFTDFFGSRMSGTPSLEKAIAFLTRQLINVPTLAGSVYADDVEIPSWQRGHETAEILTPIRRNLPIKGMGLGASTPPEGIEAEVVVVDSIEDLKAKRSEISGRIVVFNLNYEESLLPVVPKAAALGALAVLMRSPTPFSIYSIHATGVQYGDLGRRIPSGTITVEDADLISRFYKKGKKVNIKMILESNTSTTAPTVLSQNIIVEFEGRQYSDEYVVVSGHSDSWDIGQGAFDGIGAILTYEFARIFDAFKFYPRRTIRAAIWTGSKFGNLGVRNYLNIHDSDLTSKYSAAMGADLGCLKAMGYIFSGSRDAACVIYEILQLFNSPAGRSLIHVNGTVSDVSWFSYPTGGIGARPMGIPSLTLNGDDGHTSWYADSEGDTVSVLDSDQLDICLGMFTSMAYILADLNDPLPLF